MGIFDLLGISSNENRDSAGPQLACPSDEVIVESQERTTSSPLPPHVTSNTPILEKIIETSITLGYQSDVWGVKRIAEDGIQNHLPSDSHGSRFDIEFLVDGKVIPYSEKSEVDPSRVKAIRFIDDGTGFSYDLLGVFHSTKKDEVDSVGQFGEGIKMLSAACLREGIDLEIRSRDWFARPVVNDLLIDGQNVRQMCYEVYNHQPNMQGSMTTFKDPGNEFVDYVLNLDDTVLELCGDSDVKVFKTSKGSVLKHKGRIYVKGIHITDDFKENLLFGYDLVSDTNRDRNMVNPNLLNNQIGGVIRQLDNKDLIKTILDASTITSNYMEFDALYWDRSVGGGGHGGLRVTNPEIWRETFYELFGDKAVLTAVDGWGGSLSSKKASDKLAALAGYKVIRIKSDSICQTLTGCGVETSKSISVDDNARLLQGENYNPDDVQIRVAETSLTSQYRSKKWDAKRIVLDTLANHMPNDSGGSHVDTEYFVISDKRTEGQWIKIKDKTLFDEVQALRFTDDGTGYSSKFLEFLYTTKESSEAVGQFGEGLKMLCNAFLGFSKSHEGMDLKLRSRDWVGMPFSSDLTLDDHETKRLNFRIAEGIEEMVGSTTTVYKPSIEMLKVVSSIQKFVLAFNSDYRSRSQTEDGAVFKGEKYQLKNRVENGNVFVRDFHITDSFKENLLFSYNLTSRDINPDRDAMDPTPVKSAVHSIISRCDDTEIISDIIESGVGNEKDIYEFQTIDFDHENSHVGRLYKETFNKLFGEKAVLYTGDPFIYATAKHWGYNPIKVNQQLRKTLKNSGVITDSEVIHEGFTAEYVDQEDLSVEERKVLEMYRIIDECLDVRSTSVPKVYERVFRKDGEELPYPGFFNGEINLRRNLLGKNDLFDFVDVYKHEKGHEVTGASDPQDRFRDFFERALTGYLLSDMRDKV